MVFTISTATLGGVSVFEYFYRLYNLFRGESRARPLNAPKSRLDFFQINFTIVWLVLAIELIVGTVHPIPYVRLLAMPLPTVMFYFGGVHLSLDILRMFRFKAPFRISSTPKGSLMPTALYVLVEDIVAVDGGGGQKYSLAGVSLSYGPAFGPLSPFLGFELISDERRIPGSKFTLKATNHTQTTYHSSPGPK
jgi:hypothetical protein